MEWDHITYLVEFDIDWIVSIEVDRRGGSPKLIETHGFQWTFQKYCVNKIG